MNEIKQEQIAHDATREAYQEATAEEDEFNPEAYRQHIEKRLDFLTNDAAHFCKLTSEYLKLEPERSRPTFLLKISELTEQLQERIDQAYHVVLRESIKANEVKQ